MVFLIKFFAKSKIILSFFYSFAANMSALGVFTTNNLLQQTCQILIRHPTFVAETGGNTPIKD